MKILSTIILGLLAMGKIAFGEPLFEDKKTFRATNADISHYPLTIISGESQRSVLVQEGPKAVKNDFLIVADDEYRQAKVYGFGDSSSRINVKQLKRVYRKILDPKVCGFFNRNCKKYNFSLPQFYGQASLKGRSYFAELYVFKTHEMKEVRHLLALENPFRLTQKQYTDRLKAVLYLGKALEDATLNLHEKVGQIHGSLAMKNLRFDKDGIYLSDFYPTTLFQKSIESNTKNSFMKIESNKVLERGDPNDRTNYISEDPHFFAPERYQGSIALTSDYYSVGAIMFNLMTGRSPKWTEFIQKFVNCYA